MRHASPINTQGAFGRSKCRPTTRSGSHVKSASRQPCPDEPVRFLADENFDNRVVRALLFRCPGIDIERVQDSEIRGADDESVLDWAVAQGRVVLSHDVATMIAHARMRIRARKPMLGLVIVPLKSEIGRVISDLALVAGAATMADFVNSVVYVPLK